MEKCLILLYVQASVAAQRFVQGAKRILNFKAPKRIK